MGAKHSTATVHSKNTISRRYADIAGGQNVLLIWLDDKIDEESEDCGNTIRVLRRVVNAVNIFTDGDECIKFITANSNEKVCIIISGSLGQLIIPVVHSMSQVDSIFIFCGDRKQHEQWAKEWSKIKGVFTEISQIFEALKDAVQQCEHNAIDISFMFTSSGASANGNLDELNSSFMYTQILKEILLTIEFKQEHIKKFTDYCGEVFAGNTDELVNVQKLEIKYREQTPIWWYTRGCFLYPMLNRALQTMDVNMIIMMGFFIIDLHRHIERLHAKQFRAHPHSQVLTVYRGQGLSKTVFDQLVKNKGGLVAFNTFLSTSKNRNVSLGFARNAISNHDMVGILVVMSIDPSRSTIPFASIANVSYLHNSEDRVLFSMHTVFRIHEIKSMGENNRLWQVELAMTSDNDKALHVLTERIREEIGGSNGWHRLAELLLRMGQSEKAQQIYEAMLQQASDDHEKGHIYDRLGAAKNDQGQYEEAITFYEQSLAMKQKMLPPTHPALTMCYNNIGLVHKNMGEYPKALSYYEKVLEIQQKALPPTHPNLALTFKNIGMVYNEMGDYSKALSYYEEDLDIIRKNVPLNHPNLAVTYNDIGMVYYNMGDYSKALSYYEQVLEIRQKTLPPSHPDLASSSNNIGLVYEEMGEYSKACSFFERAVDIGQHSLPTNHLKLQKWRKNLDLVKEKL